jgi:hypothetical protein
MAFNAKALQIGDVKGVPGASPDGLAYFRPATYITADTPTVVEGAGYFNGAAARMPKGTVVTAVMTTGGTPVMKNYVVTANTGAAVTVAMQKTTAG